MAQGPDSPKPPRLINPALSGISIGALWGATHVPEEVTIGPLLQFAAIVLAVMIVAGGLLAVLSQAVAIGMAFIRPSGQAKSPDSRRTRI
jgi:hypothetical protein